MASIQEDKTDVKFVHELVEQRMPVVTATQRAEAGGSLQPMFSRTTRENCETVSQNKRISLCKVLRTVSRIHV